MRRCTRVGIEVTKRCNWRCQTCFHRWKPTFNADEHRTIESVATEIDAAIARGCDHSVLVGEGEPTLWRGLFEFIQYCKDKGITSSVITNGTCSIEKAARMYETGLNHLHVSAHGMGETLDRIAGVPGAGIKQSALIEWLGESGLPWRSNATLQLENYKELPKITDYMITNGCRHIVYLGFLPHYEWNDPEKLRTVAVHPAELRPYLEESIGIIEDTNSKKTRSIDDPQILTTIRYHPMCHIEPRYWKYIVNARYVLYDPWEWDYEYLGLDDKSFWEAAKGIGGTVSVNGPPCIKCDLLLHCGGWNKHMVKGFNGAGLDAKLLMPKLTEPGAIHDQNPANHAKGYF